MKIKPFSFFMIVLFAMMGLIFLTLKTRNDEQPKLQNGIQIEPTGSQTAILKSSATITELPTRLPTGTPTVIAQATASPTPTSGSQAYIDHVKTVNGIEITLNNIRYQGNTVKADICFPVLDKEDWMIRKLSLQYDGKTITEWAASLIEPIIPATKDHSGRRCDTVYFSVSGQTDFSNFTITVQSIYAPPREGQLCDRIAYIQKKLKEKASGIEVICNESSDTAGFQIVAKPDTMSQNEALDLIIDEAYFTQKGPWVFNVHLK